MAQTAENVQITPVFYTEIVEDKVASREAGRPIMREEERIEYRIAGNRSFNFHDLAHGFHETKNGETITHAMRFPAEYRKFKETGGNTASGTPLQNLPGLTPVQISTCKALSIYSIEALASVDGFMLKSLGPSGHKLKQAAEKYLGAAGGQIDATRIFAELEAVKAENERLARLVQGSRPEPVDQTDDGEPEIAGESSDALYAGIDDDGLKARITELTGQGVRGRPSRATLINMLTELEVQRTVDPEAAE